MKFDSLIRGDKDPAPVQPSCTERLHYRRQLTHIVPGYGGKVGAFWVKRTLAWDEYTYKLDDFEFTLDETLDIVMGRIAPPSVFDVRPIVIAPAPRVFPSAIDYTAKVATVQVSLFELLAAVSA